MHVPITRYGLPQAAAYPLALAALMAALFAALPLGLVLAAAETLLCAALVWAIAFFRNPRRAVPQDDHILLSPADGTITDITAVDCPELGGRALRIGMFLSIFNVHINRMPCAARVDSVRYRPGQFKNAMSAESGRVNESNDVLMTRLAEPCDQLLVRQISGAIARRIVCEALPGEDYAQGAAFGMIKFGSRTELYLPLREGGGYDVTIRLGDKARAGLTPLVVYQS